MASIGLAELLVIGAVGLVLIAIPIAVVIAVVALQRKGDSPEP
jgi:hypothetical protein